MIMPDEIIYNPPKTTANKFVEQVTNIETNRKKIVLDDPNLLQNLIQSGHSPQDAMLLMQQMTQQSSMDSLPPEAIALMQQMISVQADPNAGASVIRKRPDYLEKAIKDVESRDRFEIDIERSSVLDLHVNQQTKEDVIKTLKTLSKVSYENNKSEAIFYFTDIDISFYFDENNTVNEIEIGEKYKHSTTKGLKIGDDLEKAIELYGNPRMKSAKGAIWNRFSILMEGKEIRLIRLKIRE